MEGTAGERGLARDGEEMGEGTEDGGGVRGLSLEVRRWRELRMEAAAERKTRVRVMRLKMGVGLYVVLQI
ncbi:unnamed protein product [Sphenostylis stenocarpa]|uniref:Uncharacterized protein n=1 Tax=Sphenostylis stenocarpa TaxID=92480 RepID=A0AA86VFC2_9FABA|nr:unnamed protein product [Sphenostylis stenocarpa]